MFSFMFFYLPAQQSFFLIYPFFQIHLLLLLSLLLIFEVQFLVYIQNFFLSHCSTTSDCNPTAPGLRVETLRSALELLLITSFVVLSRYSLYVVHFPHQDQCNFLALHYIYSRYLVLDIFALQRAAKSFRLFDSEICFNRIIFVIIYPFLRSITALFNVTVFTYDPAVRIITVADNVNVSDLFASLLSALLFPAESEKQFQRLRSHLFITVIESTDLFVAQSAFVNIVVFSQLPSFPC